MARARDRKGKGAARPRPPSAGDFATFRPQDRLIYRYTNGKGMVDADPMRLRRDLLSLPDVDILNELKVLFLTSPGMDKARLEAFDKIANAARRVFKVPPLDEGGLAEGEWVSLVLHFCNYLGTLKENFGNGPTSPTPSASAPSPTSEASEPTPPSAASTSTATGPSTETPSPSPPA